MQLSLPDIILQQNHAGLPQKEFLEQVVLEHPYFTPACFYLLKSTKETDSDYAAIAAKTALQFNNPHWLQFQLQQQPATVKEAPVIAMYAENADNDDDNAELVPPAVTITALPETTLHLAEQTAEPVIPAVATIEEENTDNDDDNSELVHEAGTTAAMPDSKIDIAANIKNAENENALAFEPMHLVDYFASQGIKLSEEVQTGDKLGKQLKSFSEWLKTMKKLHVPDATASAVISDIAIQTLAAKSNTEGEVVTEAMAEVLAQQGKAAKAIELYQKLSLLNPPKSAYFAAKIEQLKGE